MLLALCQSVSFRCTTKTIFNEPPQKGTSSTLAAIADSFDDGARKCAQFISAYFRSLPDHSPCYSFASFATHISRLLFCFKRIAPLEWICLIDSDLSSDFSTFSSKCTHSSVAPKALLVSGLCLVFYLLLISRCLSALGVSTYFLPSGRLLHFVASTVFSCSISFFCLLSFTTSCSTVLCFTSFYVIFFLFAFHLHEHYWQVFFSQFCCRLSRKNDKKNSNWMLTGFSAKLEGVLFYDELYSCCYFWLV